MFCHPLPRTVPCPGVAVPAAAARKHRPRTQFWGTRHRPDTPRPRSHLPAVPGAGSPRPHSPDTARLCPGGHVHKERSQDESQIQHSPKPPLLVCSKCRSRRQLGKARAGIPAALSRAGTALRPLRPPRAGPARTRTPPARSSAPSSAALLPLLPAPAFGHLPSVPLLVPSCRCLAKDHHRHSPGTARVTLVPTLAPRAPRADANPREHPTPQPGRGKTSGVRGHRPASGGARVPSSPPGADPALVGRDFAGWRSHGPGLLQRSYRS